MEIIQQPTTRNLIKLEVFDKDGNLVETRSVENAYTNIGMRSMYVDLGTTNLPTTATNITNNYSNNGLSNASNNIIEAQVGNISIVSNSKLYNFRSLVIAGDSNAESYNAPNTQSTVGAPVSRVNYSSCTGNMADVIDGKTYISNTIVYDYGYGNVNFTINKVAQLPDSGTLGFTAWALLPSSLTVNLDQRLIVTYVHLFDVLTYYDDDGASYTLKSAYKDVLLDSGSFMNDVVSVPYQVKCKHLMSNTVSKSGGMRVKWALANTVSSTSGRNHTIEHSGGTYTYNQPANNNPMTVKAVDANRNSIIRNMQIKFPATMPAMTGITKINLVNNIGDSTIANPLYIDFPTPWDKPADTEINFAIQWTEQFGQLTS